VSRAQFNKADIFNEITADKLHNASDVPFRQKSLQVK